MDHVEVGRHWNENAEAWTKLSRAGYDVYRDYLNTPAFLAMIPEVRGLRGLDLGCGEGSNTRQLARRGALMTGIDIAERFVAYAREAETQEPLGIDYRVADAAGLPFSQGYFDFAVAFMSLMDIPGSDRVLAEVWRVLKPGGFFQCSVTHPCTNTPHRRNLRGENRRTYALELGGYFDMTDGVVEEWLFGATPQELRDRVRPFRVPRFQRTLSEWFNAFVAVRFVLDQVEEPRANDDVVQQCPDVQDTQVMPYFLHMRWRKPS